MIRAHSQTIEEQHVPTEAQPPKPPTDTTGKRVWMLRVHDETSLDQLIAFVEGAEGISDLKPRYPYDAQKQRDYRARKKAKEEQANELQSVPTPQE